MSTLADNKQNTPAANQPEIPEQIKVPETPETRVRQKMQDNLEKVTEFKKDVKFLWIYGSIFCLVLLALIGGSYMIQEKINAEVDEYKNQASDAQASDEKSKSRLSAIQEQNNQLKNKLSAVETENAALKAAAASDEALINSGEQIILEMQKLLKVTRLYQTGKRTEARELFESINKEILPKDCLESYAYYEERLK